MSSSSRKTRNPAFDFHRANLELLPGMGRIVFTESVESVLFTEIRAAQAHIHGNIHGIQRPRSIRIIFTK